MNSNIAFRYTFAEHREVYKAMTSTAGRILYAWRGGFGWVISFGVAIAVLFASDPSSRELTLNRLVRITGYSATILIAVGLSVFVVIAIVVLLVDRMREKTVFEREEAIRLHTITFSEAGVSAGDQVSRVQTKWRAFVGLRETANLFLLLTEGKVTVAVPKRVLGSPVDLETFRNFLESKISAAGSMK